MVRKVASPAGVKRYGLPEGTPLDGSRGGAAKKVLARISAKVNAPSPKKAKMPSAKLKTPGPTPPKPKPQSVGRTAQPKLQRILGRDKKGNPQEMVPSENFGMKFDRNGAKVVEAARGVSQKEWERLPVESLKHGTPVIANEEHLKKRSIDKVVGGKEAFREGYIGQMYRDDDGTLHVADGHTRLAMYHSLGKDMPVRIMDRKAQKAASVRDAARDRIEKRHTRKIVEKADREKPPFHDNEPEPSAEAKAVAERVQGKAIAAEPNITHDIIIATERNGGEAQRLAFRLKTTKSFALKIDRNLHAAREDGEESSLDAEAAKIVDGVRYTSVVDNTNFWKAGDKLLNYLTERGYSIIEDKGAAHAVPLRDYRGRNVKMMDPNGVPFELQIHSKESLDASEKNHPLYNEWRHQDTPKERKAELAKEMGDNFYAVPLFPGSTIKERRKN